MKINYELLKSIYSGKLKLNNKKDKINLSKYDEYLPMYDIYNQKIYAVKKIDLYDNLINYHYRFINNEIKDWIENQLKKLKKSKDDAKQSIEKHKESLNIIENYDIETLISTSYSTIFKNTQGLGLNISICKRNSFNKYFSHLSPYYSKDELLNLGLNMKILKPNDKESILSSIQLDQKVHYDLCKKISKNDLSSNEILTHSEHVVDSEAISYISFYSFTGSFFMNKYLRNIEIKKNEIILPNNIYSKTIIKLNNLIKKSPNLEKEYFLYRFIWDDYFLKDLKIGDIFQEKGFLSTTRDPFYSPGSDKFGLILLKIKIKKNSKGILIENFSLYPKEEEFLFSPFSKMKLLSKDDNFKYFHTDKNYEKIITKKYEFEIINSDIDIKIKINDNNLNQNNLVNINFSNLSEQLNIIYSKNDKMTLINNFVSKNEISREQNVIPIIFNNKKFEIYWAYFDGSDSYSKFYFTKINNGITFTLYDNNLYPYLIIEFSDEMVINFANKYYYYSNKQDMSDIDLELIIYFSILFKYGSFTVSPEFKNYDDFIKIENNDQNNNKYQKLSMKNNLLNYSLYKYLKFNKKFQDDLFSSNFNNYFTPNLQYWKIDRLKEEKIPNKYLEKFDNNIIKSKSYFDFLIEIYENHPLFFKKEILIEEFNINELKFKFNSSAFIKNEKNINLSFIDIPYNIDEVESDFTYNLIFRNPIKRII